MKYRVFIPLISFLILTGCKRKSEPVFQLSGFSQLIIVNDRNEDIRLYVDNYSLFPNQAEVEDTVLNKGIVSYPHTAQGYSYLTLAIGNEKFRMFHAPGTIDSVFVRGEGDSLEITFEGTNEPIQNYLNKRARDFESIDSDWMSRVNLTHGEGNTLSLIDANMENTKRHLNHLAAHRNELPDWYYEFESQRLEYLNIGFILNSIIYRKAFLGNTEALPHSEIQKIIEKVQINNESLLGNSRYQQFLSEIVAYYADPDFVRGIPETPEEWKEHFSSRIEKADSLLTGKVKEVFLMRLYDAMLSQDILGFENDIKKRIQDEAILNYIAGRKKVSESLEGQELPYFMLESSDGNWIENAAFKDQVVMLNFWFVGCRPCIKEFPHENGLVDKYSGADVKIVNVCTDSDREDWLKTIAAHKLKTLNLYANEEWSHQLIKKFSIHSYPHSTFIRDGIIVRNHGPSASSGADSLIAALIKSDAL